MFSEEQKRQYDNLGRIEKIEVRYLGVPEDTTLVMNKNLSTPFNCAQRKLPLFAFLSTNVLISYKLCYRFGGDPLQTIGTRLD